MFPDLNGGVYFQREHGREGNKGRAVALFRDFRHRMKEDSHLETIPLLFFKYLAY